MTTEKKNGDGTLPVIVPKGTPPWVSWVVAGLLIPGVSAVTTWVGDIERDQGRLEAEINRNEDRVMRMQQFLIDKMNFPTEQEQR